MKKLKTAIVSMRLGICIQYKANKKKRKEQKEFVSVMKENILRAC